MNSEWIMLEYDNTFDPEVSFHIEVRWFVSHDVSVSKWKARSRARPRNRHKGQKQTQTQRDRTTAEGTNEGQCEKSVLCPRAQVKWLVASAVHVAEWQATSGISRCALAADAFLFRGALTRMRRLLKRFKGALNVVQVTAPSACTRRPRTARVQVPTSPPGQRHSDPFHSTMLVAAPTHLIRRVPACSAQAPQAPSYTPSYAGRWAAFSSRGADSLRTSTAPLFGDSTSILRVALAGFSAECMWSTHGGAITLARSVRHRKHGARRRSGRARAVGCAVRALLAQQPAACADRRARPRPVRARCAATARVQLGTPRGPARVCRTQGAELFRQFARHVDAVVAADAIVRGMVADAVLLAGRSLR